MRRQETPAPRLNSRGTGMNKIDRTNPNTSPNNGKGGGGSRIRGQGSAGKYGGDSSRSDRVSLPTNSRRPLTEVTTVGVMYGSVFVAMLHGHFRKAKHLLEWATHETAMLPRENSVESSHR